MDLNNSRNNEDIQYEGYAFELIYDIYRSLNTKKEKKMPFLSVAMPKALQLNWKLRVKWTSPLFLNNKWLNGSLKKLVHVIVCVDFISLGQRIQYILPSCLVKEITTQIRLTILLLGMDWAFFFNNTTCCVFNTFSGYTYIFLYLSKPLQTFPSKES